MKVLLAVDGSRDAAAAVRFLKSIRLPVRTEVLILHVHERWSEPAVLSSLGRSLQVHRRLAASRAAITEKAQSLVNEARRQFGGRGVKVRTLVAEGLPAPAILDVLGRRRVDLAVLGTRGLSAVKRFLLGSVSERVLTHGPCPVLLVRGKPLRPDSHRAKGVQVLVAVDDSPHARAAMRLLARLGLPRSAVVTLLHVAATHDYATSRLFATGRSDLRRMAEEILRARSQVGARIVEKSRRLLRPRRLTVNTLVVEGHPAEAIIKTAERMRADLVVMGSRGLTGLEHLLLGSVSHKVARHASCSVVVVRKNGR